MTNKKNKEINLLNFTALSVIIFGIYSLIERYLYDEWYDFTIEGFLMRLAFLGILLLVSFEGLPRLGILSKRISEQAYLKIAIAVTGYILVRYWIPLTQDFGYSIGAVLGWWAIMAALLGVTYLLVENKYLPN